MATLRDVLDGVASFVNQDPALATGVDLTSQINLINQAQREWAETAEWKSLRIPFQPSFGSSSVSLGLPSNFKALMSPVYNVAVSGSDQYKEINPSDRFTQPTGTKYLYILGNDVTGKSIQLYPGIASGASLNCDIQIYPSSMATLQDIVTCPSVQFLTMRTISKILGARSDERFTIYKAESDDLLSAMLDDEAAFSGAQDNVTNNYYSKNNFRVGQD